MEREEIHYIFLTGDIANKGLSNEYELFLDEFIFPVYEKTQNFSKIFIVPGNHDIDRNQARAVKRYNILNDIPEFFDPTDKGVFERKVLFDRFKNYKEASIHELTSSGSDWLYSKEGIFTHTDTFGDISLGILGLNTAWLSGEGNDEKKLSPGKSLAENGLGKINDCNYKIVLGHHPTNWYDEDIDPISALFSKNGVIYLHGHLHKSSVSQIYGAGYQYYSLQSGASFQARESEIYKNRILVSELDFTKNELLLNPYQWSKNHQEWCIDGEAFPEAFREPGKDSWSFPLNFNFDREKHKIKKSLKTKKTKDKTIPSKWKIIDHEFISSVSADMSDAKLLSFFDGRKPKWEDSISTKIPRRKIIKELIEKVANLSESNEPNVLLLYGAGGEGKSTILMQLVQKIVQDFKEIKILSIDDSDEYRPWPMRFILALPQIATSWLIVCDDADYIAKNIFDTVKSLSNSGRNDIHFLISSRDTDWIASRAQEWPWNSYCKFDTILLRGLNYEDCKLIVKAWGSVKDGLGLLSQYDEKDAANRLFIAAKTEEAKDDHEGAFLGAMLQTRKGDRLHDHIKILLGRLNERILIRKKSSSKLTLMDAFTYIAAMHSEGLYYLTKDLLSETLFCDMGEIKRQIIGPLGEEALASAGGTFIYTRHRSIAESSVKILSEVYHIDFDEIFIELVQAAKYLGEKGAYVPSFSKWQYLSSHFFHKGQVSLAIRLDQAILKIDPANTFLIVHLSSLFRKAGQPELSINLFREHSTSIGNNARSFFYEWGTSEGNADNHAMSVVCTLFSLSDQVEIKYPDIKHILKCFEGLFIAFTALHEKYNIRFYKKSYAAICKLSEKLKMPDNDRKKFDDRFQECIIESLEFSDYNSAFNTLLKGLYSAWDQKEISPPNNILNPDNLSFDSLLKILNL